MARYNKKHFIVVGLIVAILSFVLLLVGVKFILGNEIHTQNIIAYIILSLILGGISSTLYYFKQMITLTAFLIGIVVGFFELYRIFLNGMDGWADLVGLMTFFTWVAIGLITGLVVQFISYLYKKKISGKDIS